MADDKHGGLTIHRGDSGLVADKDIFATRDGRVVEADHAEANTLIARAGQPIPDATADTFGIKEMKGSVKREAETEKEADARESVKEERKDASADREPPKGKRD